MLRADQPKQILLSKRNYIFYVDRVKVVGELGNVRLISKEDKHSEFETWLNVPQRNTSLLLLGHGSSVTNEAMRLLAEANVIVGFCGTSGSPLYSMSDFVFSSYVDNYRPTEYMQAWVKKWFDDKLPLAKVLLNDKINRTFDVWEDNEFLYDNEVYIDVVVRDKTIHDVSKENDIQKLLLIEARWTKYLYKIISEQLIGGIFVRDRVVSDDATKQQRVNAFINHGNYLAYGLAAVALHGLGINYSFPVLHGMTRRGGLVLDVAELIKDPYVLPLAFEYGCSRKRIKQSAFRSKMIEMLHTNKATNYCFEFLKELAMS